MKVRFETARGSFDAELVDGPITTAIVQRLPLSTEVNRWGDEIYFDVPVTMTNVHPVRDVRVGDIGYWPDGPSLCIFFGKTPASTSNQPRAGSDVTVVGHTDAAPSFLRSVAEGTALTLDLRRG